jgi:hypothetical protein
MPSRYGVGNLMTLATFSQKFPYWFVTLLSSHWSPGPSCSWGYWNFIDNRRDAGGSRVVVGAGQKAEVRAVHGKAHIERVLRLLGYKQITTSVVEMA